MKRDNERKQRLIQVKALEYGDFQTLQATYNAVHPKWVFSSTTNFDGFGGNNHKPYDAILETPNGRYYVEIKSRPEYTIETFQDCLLNKSKIDELRRICALEGVKPMIAVIYPKSGVAAYWGGFGNYEIKTIKCAKTTYGCGDAETAETQEKYSFPISQAVIEPLSDSLYYTRVREAYERYQKELQTDATRKITYRTPYK